jgi:transposase-like protein
MSSDMSQGQKSDAILALTPKESKGQNDVFFCYVTTNQFGKDRKGYQRFRCPKCGKTFTEPHNA